MDRFCSEKEDPTPEVITRVSNTTTDLCFLGTSPWSSIPSAEKIISPTTRQSCLTTQSQTKKAWQIETSTEVLTTEARSLLSKVAELVIWRKTDPKSGTLGTMIFRLR